MNFLLPVDIVVADEFSADANTQIVDVDGIPAIGKALTSDRKHVKFMQTLSRTPSWLFGTDRWAYSKSSHSPTVHVQ